MKTRKRASKGKRVLSLVLSLLMVIGMVHLGVTAHKAEAAVTGAPATNKQLIPNGDGTYTLALSVTGAAESSSTTQVTKANVILVVDTSSSMNSGSGTGFTYTEYSGNGQQGTEYWRLDEENHYVRVYWRGGQWRLTNNNNGQVYNGTVYTRSGSEISRLAAEKDALTKEDGIIDKLVAQNDPDDPIKRDIIEVAIVSFGGAANDVQSFTPSGDTLKTTINGLGTSTGTNWEEGLAHAKALADTISASQQNEDVYIIFLTDGEPTTHAGDYTVNTNFAEEWAEAVDDAWDIVQAGYHLYGLFTWGNTARSTYLSSLIEYAYSPESALSDITYQTSLSSDNAKYFTNADSTEALISALEQIVHDITNSVGYTNVELEDGTTTMTNSSVKTTASGDVTGLKYYRSGGSYGNGNNGLGTEWTVADGAPEATINDDGEVDWNLGDMILEDGVTYTVTFVVWPSQESLDLVADLNNGIISYNSLTQDQKDQIFVSGGVYSLKTNTDFPEVTYSIVTTTEVDGVPTTTTSEPVTTTITNPPPVGLAETKLHAVKSWEDDLDPTQREEVGGSVELFLKVDGKYYYLDENKKPMGVILTEDSDWTETDYISIAPGLMVTEDSPAYDASKPQVTWEGVKYAIIEPGHEYLFEESDINNHFELTAYIHHPMIMGTDSEGNPHTVDIVFTKDASGNITGIESVSEMGDNLSATNTLKGGINISKKVVDEDGTEIANTDPFTINVTVTDADGNTLPTKTADNEAGTQYNIDYRIYYGTNNPAYETSGDRHRSDHIYVSGTEFTETIYVGDTIRVVNVEDGAVYTVDETAPTGYELVGVDYTIKYGANGTETEDPDHAVQGNSASSAVVTNKYTFGDLQVSKTVEVESGDEEQAKAKEFEFTFKLYSDDTKAEELTGLKYNYTITKADNTTTTGTIAEGGTFKLKDGEYIVIEMLPEGSYYEITETEAAGYETEAEGDTGAIVKDEVAEAEFTNTYSVTSVIVDPPVKKDIEGNEELYNNGDFTFTIANTAAPDGVTAPMPENTEITNSAEYEREDMEGYYEFGEIEFTAPGEYTYTVTESGSAVGVTNDAEATKELTFTVTDDGEGALTVTPGTDSAVFTFTNTYKSGGLKITKTVVNPVNDNDTTKFTFTLTLQDAEGNTVEGPFPYTIGETEGNIASGGTLQLAGGETAVVTEIPDGVTYTVTEADVDGYENTSKTGDTGTVDAEATADPEAKFTNTYSASGTIELEASKELVGRDWKEGETVTFTLLDPDGNKIDEQTIRSNTTVTFEEIEFTEADIANSPLKYTISETSTLPNGVTKSADITATVKLEDNGDGTLTATASYNNKGTIVNTYEASPVKAQITVSKEIDGYIEGEDANGNVVDRTFNFTMTGPNIDGELTTSVTTKGGKGEASFDEIEFTFEDMVDDEGNQVTTKEFTYHVTETEGSDAGFTYDTKTYDVIVTVEDDLDGHLKVTDITKANETSNVNIINTFVEESIDVQLHLKKVIEDQSNSAEDATFTFQLLDEDGNLVEEVEVTTEGLEGSVDFEPITFNTAGTYNYTLQEIAPAEDTDDGNADAEQADDTAADETAEDAQAADDAAADETAKDAQAADDTAADETAEDAQTANDAAADETAEDAQAADGTAVDETTEDAQAADGTAADEGKDETQEPAEGEDEPTIQGAPEVVEAGDASSAWTYDTTAYPVVITVTNNFETAKLEASVTIDGADTTTLTVTNIYKAASTEATLEVIKEIEDTSGSAYETTFDFTLADEDGNTIGTASVTGAGTATFDAITYEKAGTYNYTITETAGDADGYIYDTTEYPVVVTVVDENGKLVASVAYGEDSKTELTVTNIYDPEDATAALKARKVVDDQSDSAPDETFKFQLIGSDGKVVETVTRKNGGYVEFSELAFDKVGTYEYTIKEVAGSTPGYTYDTDEYLVEIEVTDDGKGNLQAEITYLSGDEAVITNTYKADPADITLSVNKKVEGTSDGAKAQDFSFTLTDADGEAVQTITINGEGTADFDAITYEKAGTYTYTLTEENGGAAGYTYDTSTYTVTVTVTDEGGKLAASAEYSKDGEAADDVTFTNTYSTSSAVVDLSAKKTLKGRDLAEGEFQFTLEVDGEVIETVRNAKDGTITFSTLTFDEAGTHTYKIYEFKGTLENVTYDTTVYQGTITVTDDGNGKLVATVEGANGITFTNTYEKPEEPPVPPTGDNNNIVIWLVIMTLAALGFISLVIFGKVRKKN